MWLYFGRGKLRALICLCLVVFTSIGQVGAQSVSKNFPWKDAKWVLLFDFTLPNGYGNKRYFDSAHTVKDGANLVTYILMSENQPSPLFGRQGQPLFQSMVFRAAYDCKRKLWSSLEGYTMSGKNGDGDVIKELAAEYNWIPFLDEDRKFTTTYCKS
jgi:hypothetical protein